MVETATMAPKNKKAMDRIFRSVHGLAKNYFFVSYLLSDGQTDAPK
jgi:hypothetical protein